GEQIVVDTLVYEYPGSRSTILTRVEETGLCHGTGGSGHGRIIEHHRWSLAAQFQMCTFQTGGSGRGDLLPGTHRSGDRDQHRRGVLDQHPARIAAAADNVQ